MFINTIGYHYTVKNG